MGAPEIPRKAVAEPPPAYSKEVDAHSSAPGSDWDMSNEQHAKRKPVHVGVNASVTAWAISDRFDRLLPPHKRYLGRSRRTILIAGVVSFLCLLALIVGLAVGLSGKTENLPLPNGAETYTGDLTYYNPGLGACGVDSSDNDPIAAVSHYTFDAVQVGSNPNANPLCGRKIRATRVNEATGKSVSIDVTVVDRCTGCAPTDIDVSPAMFNKMAHEDLGRVLVTWAWLP